MLLSFNQFGGANQALHPLLLPDGAAVTSLDCKPGRGDLRPIAAALNVATVGASATTIYRMGRTAPSDTSYWLQWAADVDVARGFIAEDTTERTFWTGDGVPKWTNNAIGLGAAPYPDSSGVRILGVPKPNADPTLAEQVAGTGDDETRAYVVTWVNDLGEESMPSAADTITCKPGATIRVTRNATVPTGAYGLTAWRVYRTVAGNDEDYFFVAEVVAATTFVDTTDATLNTANPLLSEDWAMPPSNLKGLKALWNGIMVGWIGKALCFSEPFRPYAWPVRYQLVLDEDIVGIGRWQQSLVVVTVGKPYLVTGSTPDAMLPQLIEFNQACVAKRSVVELGYGVAWASPDGYAFMGEGGARLLTAGTMERADWQALTPSTIVAGEDEGWIVASYDPTGASPRASLRINPLAPAGHVEHGVFFGSDAFICCYRDPIGDAFYVLASDASGNVRKWDAGAARTLAWKSKVVRVSRPTCFAFGQIVADAYPVTFSLWAGTAGAALTAIVSGQSITSRAAFRLPAGFRADLWQFQVQSTAAVQIVQFAHSAEELNAA